MNLCRKKRRLLSFFLSFAMIFSNLAGLKGIIAKAAPPGSNPGDIVITELANYSGSSNYYGYIELYNNTEQDINLKNYTISYPYEYGNTATEDLKISTDVIIKAKDVLVISNVTKNSKTFADFKTFWGTVSGVDTSQLDITKFYAHSLRNMEHGAYSSENVIVKDPANVEIYRATYVGNSDGNTMNKAIIYDFNSSTPGVAANKQSGKTPTPGVVLESQVPPVTPKVISTVPLNNAIDVSTVVNPQLTFICSMNAASLTSETIYLTNTQDGSGTKVPAAVSYNNKVVVITPTNELGENTTYYLHIDINSVTSAAGLKMNAYEPVKFTTGLHDSVAPTVANVNPTDGAMKISSKIQPAITFNENIKGSSITYSNIYLSTDAQGLDIVPGTVSYNNRTATIVPSAALLPSTTYYINLKNGIKDLTGNELQAVSYSFTVGDKCQVIALNPENNSVIAKNQTIAVKFTGNMSADAYPYYINDYVQVFQGSTQISKYSLTIGRDTTNQDIITVKSSSTWTPGATITLKIKAGLKDATGFAKTADENFTFTIKDDPKISSSTPVKNDTSVALDSQLNIVFNHEMNKTTLEGTTNVKLQIDDFTTYSNWSDIPSMVSLGSDNKTLTINPTLPLYPGKNYKIIITYANIKDSDGVALTGSGDITFKTAGTADTVQPVATFYPANGANAYASDTIKVVFNKPMDKKTISKTNLYIFSGASYSPTILDGNITANEEGTEFIVTPTVPLAIGTQYTLKVDISKTPAIRTASGLKLSASASSAFTIIENDTIAPTITATTPTNGDTNVNIMDMADPLHAANPILITFSEKIKLPNNTSMYDFVKVKEDPNGTNVDANIWPSIKADGKTIAVVPSTSLWKEKTTYEVTIKAGLLDLSGNPLVSDYVFSFTYGDFPVKVVSVTPEDKSQAVSVNTSPKIVFSAQMQTAGINSVTDDYNVKLLENGTAAVNIIRTFDVTTKTLTLTPLSPLKNNTSYTIKLDGAFIKDISNIPLKGNTEFTFKTANNDALLNDIRVNSETIQGFSKNTFNYDLILPADSTGVPDIAYTKSDMHSNVVIDIPESLPGQAKLTVTAEDGLTTQVYTINMRKQSSEATLSSILIDGIPLADFSSDKLEYNIILKAGTILMPDITFIKKDANANAALIPLTQVPGTASIAVTAEDGDTSLVYKLNFRYESSDAALTDIKINGVTITNFSKNVYDYNIVLPVGTTKVPEVTYALSDNNAKAAIQTAETLPGDSVITITAEDGKTTLAYTVHFTVMDPLTVEKITFNGAELLEGQTNVPLDAVFDISFNRELNESTIGTYPNFNIYITKKSTGDTDYTVYDVLYRVENGKGVVTATPSILKWDEATTYYLIVTDKVKDKEGNSAVLFKRSFTTKTITPLNITKAVIIKADDSEQDIMGATTSVATIDVNTKRMEISFDHSVLPVQENGLVKLYYKSGSFYMPLSGAVVTYTENKIVVNYPTMNGNTNYKLSLFSGILGSEESKFKNNTDFMFKTPILDAQRPHIQSITAGNAAINIDGTSVIEKDAIIKVTFDKIVDTNTLKNFGISRLFVTKVKGSLANSDKITTGITFTTVNNKTVVTLINSTMEYNKTYYLNAVAGIAGTDGITMNPVEVAFKTEASSNANLSELSLTGVPMDPSFDMNVTEYKATIANNVSSVQVNASVSDSNASILVNGMQLVEGKVDIDNLAVGENTIKVEVTAQSGLKKEYKIIVNRLKSNNANLSSLQLSCGTLTPEFNSSITEYEALVQNEVTSLEITAVTVEMNAAVTINNTIPVNNKVLVDNLVTGENNVAVKVIAQDNSEKLYTIKIIRAKSNNTDLKSLNISSGNLNPSFNPSVTSYSAAVGNDVKSLEVTPVVDDPTAKVLVNNKPLVGGKAVIDNLSVGENTVNIEVTAENGSKKQYTVVVTREKSSNADLKSLYISSGTLTPSFSSGTTLYTATVGNEVRSVEITPAAADTTAKVLVNNKALIDGKAVIGNLAVGENIVNIEVTAENGFTKLYSIVVTREKSSNANLSSLTISKGTLTPSFSSNIASYSAVVENNVTNVEITPVVEDNTAAVTVNGETLTNRKVIVDNLVVGVNNIKIEVIAENGNKKVYTIALERQKSNNAKLSSISIREGDLTPAFNPDVTNYSIRLGNNITSLEVVPVVQDATASVLVNERALENGKALINNLSLGSNIIRIEVTAQDGTKKNYVITVEVFAVVEKINLDRQEITLKIGESTTLNAEVLPSNAAYKSLEWRSSNKLIAEVDGNGKVKAVSEGEAVITAVNLQSGKSAECVVKITKENEPIVIVNNNLEEVINKLQDPQVKEIKIEASINQTAAEEIFEAVRGTDKLITFDCGDLQWTFKGTDIISDNLADIELSMTDTNEEVMEKIEASAGNNSIIAVTFKHHGVLPGKAAVKIKLDEKWLEGKDKNNIYMYYYNSSTNKAEEMKGPYKVDEQGYITVELEHCSSYFFADKDLFKTVVIPKTGSAVDFTLLLIIGLLLMSVGVYTASSKNESV